MRKARDSWIYHRVCHCALALAILLGTGSCSQSQPLSIVVFLEATPWPQANDRILNKYLYPIYNRVVRSQQAVHLEIYAITANTEAGTALLTLDLPARWRTSEEAAALAGQFRSLQESYQRVYPSVSNPSYLVDILGATIVLDKILGRTSAETTVHAIYLSDLVQREELADPSDERSDRYDFTNSLNARTLDQCRQDLEPKFSRYLLNRDRFHTAAVHLVPLGVAEILRESFSQDGNTIEYRGTSTVSNQDDIQKFWQQDFFGNFLQVGSAALYQAGVQPALDDIGL